MYPSKWYPCKKFKYGKYFTFRPFLQCVDHLNVTPVGQLYGDGNLYEGVNLVEQFISGRIFTFQINRTRCIQ